MIFFLYSGTSALIIYIFLTSRGKRNIVQLCTSTFGKSPLQALTESWCFPISKDRINNSCKDCWVAVLRRLIEIIWYQLLAAKDGLDTSPESKLLEIILPMLKVKCSAGVSRSFLSTYNIPSFPWKSKNWDLRYYATAVSGRQSVKNPSVPSPSQYLRRQ